MKPNIASRRAMIRRNTSAYGATRNQLLILAGFIGFVALILFFYFNWSRSPDSTPRQHTTAPARTKDQRISNSMAHGFSPQKASLGFCKGDRLVYTFRRSGRYLKGAGARGITPVGATPPSITMRVKQEGELVAKIYDETDTGWVVGFELRQPSITLTAEPANVSMALQDLATATAGEILTFIQKCGRIEKLTAPETMTPDALNHWKDILTRWQVILSDEVESKKWKRTEEDTTGVYVADYLREANGPPTVIKKSKNSYLKVHTATQATAEISNTITGITTITLSPYQTLIEGTENVQLSLGGIGTSVRSDASFSFRLRLHERDAAILQAGPVKVATLDKIPVSLPWAGQVIHAGNVSSSGKPGTDIHAEIANMEALQTGNETLTADQVRALESIRDLIRADDNAVEAILDKLAETSGRSELASALIGMLGAAGTPAAQFGLLTIAASTDWPMEQRMMAVFSFAQVTQPVPEIDSLLQSLRQEPGELANSALLILAGMANLVRDSDPQRFDQISRYVIANASAADLSLNYRIVGLDAIGNLGPRDVPDTVLQAYKSPDDVLR